MGTELARGMLGLLAFTAMAWGLSEERRPSTLWRVGAALLYQFVFAIALTHVPAIATLLGAIAHGVDALQNSAGDGARFVFGYLAGGPQPYAAAPTASSPFIFAFQALPAILLVSGLSALLWHWRILQVAVRGCAWVFGRLFGVSGPVGVSTSACIFLGMVEAPLLVRPLLPTLARGELFIIMVDGMSVVAGSTMILLGSVIGARIPGAFVHILTASLVSTPMAIALARLIVPSPSERVRAPLALASPYRSSLDALTSGTISAIHMAANVAALLIVFVGLVGLINRGLGNFSVDGIRLSLGTIFGWVFSPIAWLMGVPSGDYVAVGGLLGTKVTTNEVVAFGQFAALPPGALSSKGALMVTYALASFGNFGSVAILIGMLTTFIPEKADEIVRLGPRALAASFLTSCMTGTVIGLLHSLL